ncbi:N-acetylmannosamine-6-phosphate 2-epimerase [Escherichia coli]|nr:N-acetylmannosamine-6-phosphate 2-epimerase [Escherichia coli]
MWRGPQATRAVVSVPITGIVKRDLAILLVRITAYIEDTRHGAGRRARHTTTAPTARVRFCRNVKRHVFTITVGEDRLLNASTAWHAVLGVEIIGTTLSGYTTPETPEEPIWRRQATLSDAGCRVIAEGRYNTPAQAVMRHGAWAVTVGSAITRLGTHRLSRYNTAMKKAVL